MISVAVAVISNAKEQVLITRRCFESTHGGYWEFPGGKIQQQESTEEALIREVKEEVGLDVLEYSYLGDIQHQYDTRYVHLFVYHVTRFLGEPACCETQLAYEWVEKEALSQYQFPAGNTKILQWLKNG